MGVSWLQIKLTNIRPLKKSCYFIEWSYARLANVVNSIIEYFVNRELKT